MTVVAQGAGDTNLQIPGRTEYILLNNCFKAG